jgi:hypothetical protein
LSESLQGRSVPQGVAAARNAWKKKNAKPETKKDERRARPTGRGEAPPAHAQRGGRHAAGGRGRGAQALAVQQQLHAGRGGGGTNSNSGLRSEKSAWMALIDDLKKKCALSIPCAPVLPPSQLYLNLPSQ